MFFEEENLNNNKTYRKHLSIILENGKLTVLNNSLNGTFVNGAVIEKKSIIVGDRIPGLRHDFEIFQLKE